MTAADIAFVHKRTVVYKELLKSGARHHSQQQIQVCCTTSKRSYMPIAIQLTMANKVFCLVWLYWTTKPRSSVISAN